MRNPRITRRQEGVALTLGLGLFLWDRASDLQKTGHDPFPVNAWSVVLIVVAVLWLLAPARSRIGILGIIPRWLYRSWLAFRGPDEWDAGNVTKVGGAELFIRAKEDVEPVSGFLCEVQGPAGIYYGYTPEAAEVLNVARGPARLPKKEGKASLLFPGEFIGEEGNSLPPEPAIPNGRYHALWWCWDAILGRISAVKKRFLAASCFAFGPAGATFLSWRCKGSKRL